MRDRASRSSAPSGTPDGADGTYYHPQYAANVRKVLLGFHQVSRRADEMLVTTLGSCVAACVRDPVASIGGMNHFLLPDVPDGQDDQVSSAARYGSVAMERLINAILAGGGRRERLEVKVFGGAKVIKTSVDVGDRNAAFVLDYVRREGLRLVSQDLGGRFARRVHFYPVTGRCFRRALRPEALSQTIDRELNFETTLQRRPLDGEVELFGDP